MSEKFEKQCPLCHNVQRYSDKYHLQRAIKTNAPCANCSRKLPSKKRKDLIGNIYGHLTVISFVEQKNDGHQYWQCKCDCGNETVVKQSHLTGHTIRSCGCVHRYIQEKHPHWTGIGKISGTYIHQVHQSASKRGLSVLVTKEQMWQKFLDQNGKCALTGVELKFDSNNSIRDGNASLDRIDSSKDYSLDNIQWVHKIVNVMKQDLKESEFFEWCKLVYERSKV